MVLDNAMFVTLPESLLTFSQGRPMQVQHQCQYIIASCIPYSGLFSRGKIFVNPR